MDGGHGVHGRPGEGMLTLLELRHLGLMTGAAGLGSRNFYFGHIGGGGVLLAVAGFAAHVELAVAAQLPVGNDVGRDFAVALDALGGSAGRRLRLCGAHQKWREQEKENSCRTAHHERTPKLWRIMGAAREGSL